MTDYKLVSRGSAHIPQRFWDVMITKDPEIIKRELERGAVVRSATPTEVERCKRFNTYCCFGDVGDQFFKQGR